MHAIIRQRMESRKRRVVRRSVEFHFPNDLSQPILRGGTIRCELARRAAGTAYGGIGLVQQLIRELKLAAAIHARLHLFNIPLPDHESDHALYLAYNTLW